MAEICLRDFGGLLKKEGLLVSMDLSGKGDQKIEYLTYNSKAVRSGTLFVCKGKAFKEEYLMEAVARGAVGYVSEKVYVSAKETPCLLVDNIRLAMPVLADTFFQKPWQKLKITAFGGTKGKSTSTYFLKAIVDDYMRETGGKESALLSSIDQYDGVIRRESNITTPESIELYEHMANAVKTGISFMEMEASSQGLKYNRMDRVRFDVSVFMNIAEDHISPIEHKDFEDYLTSKMKMFSMSDKTIVNLDSDSIGRVFPAAREALETYSFSLKDEKADFYGYDIHKEQDEIHFRIRCKDFNESFALSMNGFFNVENALAAAAAAHLYGIPVRFIRSGLYRTKVSGRMELFRSRDGMVTAIVDYAHNRLSFEKLFGSVRIEFPGCAIVAVFGCPGGKAFIRRKDLGELAGFYCKKVYLCAEDPGEEPPLLISEEMAIHVAKKGCPYEIIEDRGVAIHKAIMECREPTIVLVVGKGRETYQKYGRVYASCPSDGDYVERYIGEYDASPHHAYDYIHGSSAK